MNLIEHCQLIRSCFVFKQPGCVWYEDPKSDIWLVDSRPGKNIWVPAPWYRYPGMDFHLAGYPNPNVSREVLQDLICFMMLLWFLHQIMKNKQNHNKQISERNDFWCVYKWFWYISLSDMREFLQILFPSCFCPKNLWFLRKSRWYGYPGTRPEITYPTQVHKYPYSPRPSRFRQLQHYHSLSCTCLLSQATRK